MTPLACHCSNQELLVPTRDVYCPPPPSACRYGENPHQKAAFYKDQSLRESAAGGVATSTVHWGKEMSYNNYLVCVWGGGRAWGVCGGGVLTVTSRSEAVHLQPKLLRCECGIPLLKAVDCQLSTRLLTQSSFLPD